MIPALTPALRRSRPIVRVFMLVVLGGWLSGTAFPALADHIPEDASNGDLIHFCDNCHAPTDEAINLYFPKLSGQHYEYLVRQIRLFREGGDGTASRRHPTMELHTRHLSEDEVEAIARYYASRNCTDVRPADATPVRTRCAKCHGPHGISTDPEIPNLIGQNVGYLENQLRAFIKGERSPAATETRIHRFDETMAGVVRGLTDEETMTIVYYATLECH